MRFPGGLLMVSKRFPEGVLMVSKRFPEGFKEVSKRFSGSLHAWRPPKTSPEATSCGWFQHIFLHEVRR